MVVWITCLMVIFAFGVAFSATDSSSIIANDARVSALANGSLQASNASTDDTYAVIISSQVNIAKNSTLASNKEAVANEYMNLAVTDGTKVEFDETHGNARVNLSPHATAGQIEVIVNDGDTDRTNEVIKLKNDGNIAAGSDDQSAEEDDNAEEKLSATTNVNDGKVASSGTAASFDTAADHIIAPTSNSPVSISLYEKFIEDVTWVKRNNESIVKSDLNSH